MWGGRGRERRRETENKREITERDREPQRDERQTTGDREPHRDREMAERQRRDSASETDAPQREAGRDGETQVESQKGERGPRDTDPKGDMKGGQEPEREAKLKVASGRGSLSVLGWEARGVGGIRKQKGNW